jgi:hypothetical protein
MLAYESAAVNWSGHRRILGICWLIYGVLAVCTAILFVLSSGTATVMFGALLARVANPFALMADFHIAYVGLVILTALSGIFGILASLTLLASTSKPPARTLAFIAALLSVSGIPVGTTLGIYTLVVLFSSGTSAPLVRA